MDGAGGQAESPDVRAGFAVAGFGQDRGDGLAEGEGVDLLGVLGPVAASDAGAGDAGCAAAGVFLETSAAQRVSLAGAGVEVEKGEFALADDSEDITPVPILTLALWTLQVMLVLDHALLRPRSALQCKRLVL